MNFSARFATRSLCLALAAFATGMAIAAAGQQAILDHYAELAKAQDPAFVGFSPPRGEAFFRAKNTTGNPDISSCTSCHTSNPTSKGETRVGKPIAPMAVSVTPDRFTDLAKVEKWFRRNCQTVLGRECTPLEKGDFIDFMTSR